MKTQEEIKLEWRQTLERLVEATEEINSWSNPQRWSDPIWDLDFLTVQQHLLKLLELRRELHILLEMEAFRRERKQQQDSAEGGGST